MFKVIYGLCLSYLSDVSTFNKDLNNYSLRSSRTNLVLPKQKQAITKIVLHFRSRGLKCSSLRSKRENVPE